MRKSHPLLFWTLLPCLGLLAAGAAARGQGPREEVIPSRFRLFRIPFQPGAGQRRLKQLQLYVSLDQGRTWQPSATATPDQGFFKFETDRDGLFWFTVQTLDVDG